MGNRPAKIYRVPKKRIYTRKEYMRSMPGSKITIFEMGELTKPEQFPVKLSIKAKEGGQITHNALEAARIAANRNLVNNLGRSNFYLKILLYPHVVLRENKQATGAGADRVSDGMRRSFGKAVSIAANTKKGQKIIIARIKAEDYNTAKGALKRAVAKLPMPCKIAVEEGKELLKI